MTPGELNERNEVFGHVLNRSADQLSDLDATTLIVALDQETGITHIKARGLKLNDEQKERLIASIQDFIVTEL